MSSFNTLVYVSCLTCGPKLVTFSSNGKKRINFTFVTTVKEWDFGIPECPHCKGTKNEITLREHNNNGVVTKEIISKPRLKMEAIEC
jgi:hypothetical protein